MYGQMLEWEGVFGIILKLNKLIGIVSRTNQKSAKGPSTAVSLFS